MQNAKAEPLHLSQVSVTMSDALYFVDLVREQLTKLGDRDFNREGQYIYTSLDPDLQRRATAAVDNTTTMIDAQVDKLYAKHHKGEAENAEKAITSPQVALVALNPHTVQVLLVACATATAS